MAPSVTPTVGSEIAPHTAPLEISAAETVPAFIADYTCNNSNFLNPFLLSLLSWDSFVRILYPGSRFEVEGFGPPGKRAQVDGSCWRQDGLQQEL